MQVIKYKKPKRKPESIFNEVSVNAGNKSGSFLYREKKIFNRFAVWTCFETVAARKTGKI